MFEVARVEIGEPAVGEVEDGERDAEGVDGAFRLLLPASPISSTDRPRSWRTFVAPALRERENVDVVALADLPGDRGAGAERLVVGVGEDVEERHRGEGK